jgi:hypothetical protein
MPIQIQVKKNAFIDLRINNGTLINTEFAPLIFTLSPQRGERVG